MPTPEWAQCHVEIYEAPGFLDDCFRSGWALFQSAASESFVNADDISGDYATMMVTEGVTPSGCGYRKDISSEALATNTYPLIRVRLRGRGTTPQYRVEVEYTDASVTDSGWINAPTSMGVKTLELTSGKTVKYVKLYARCSTASGIAYIDYDYAVVMKNWPIIPTEIEEVDVDLQTTVAVSGMILKLLNDVLLGVTARRYTLDENMGGKAYDLSRNKGHGSIVNATWNTGGRHGSCLYFLASSSCRLDTGFTTTIPATGALTIAFWVKASSGATGVVCGFGKDVGADWNRVQFNWSSDKLRLYVKDDSANIRQYTSTKTVADNAWHLVVGVINPASDKIELYIDGDYDGGASGTLGTITLTAYDLTWGCLHNESGYSSHTTAYVDEAQVFTRALTEEEAYTLFTRDPPSGAARAGVGNLVMVYLAAQTESVVYKLITARVIDRVSSGDPDNPLVTLTGEDLGEILHERTFTKEYATARWISGVAEDIVTDSVPELDKAADQTDRTITNVFRDEGVWSLLQKLAEAAHYSSGEYGANFYVDPGGCLRFKKYGAFSCGHAISDGSDGDTANILDIQVRETIKGNPRLANEVKIIVFEEEAIPKDEDSWTESADSWSSPDPTDANYPQSDTGDKQSGTASIHFNTTNPGTQYRMRHIFGEVDLTGIDQIKFWFKYGSGLSPENLEVRMQKGVWIWTTDYYIKSGLSVPSADTWSEYTINLSDFTKGGNPGKIVDHLHIRPYRSAGDLGTGGFLVDKLRFIRSEKAGTASDATSQGSHGKRTLREVDKTINDMGYAGYVAGNIVEHRKNPHVTVHARVPGRGQLGYRPPQTATVTSLKDGIDQAGFQIQRARHVYRPGEGYVCDLELAAALKPDGSYEAKVAPSAADVGAVLARLRLRQMEGQLNSLRSTWE